MAHIFAVDSFRLYDDPSRFKGFPPWWWLQTGNVFLCGCRCRTPGFYVEKLCMCERKRLIIFARKTSKSNLSHWKIWITVTSAILSTSVSSTYLNYSDRFPYVKGEVFKSFPPFSAHTYTADPRRNMHVGDTENCAGILFPVSCRHSENPLKSIRPELYLRSRSTNKVCDTGNVPENSFRFGNPVYKMPQRIFNTVWISIRLDTHANGRV